MLRLDVTSRLIRPFSSSKGQGGVLQVMDCSATRILFLSITVRHQRPTGGPVGGSYPAAEVQSAYSIALADRAPIDGTPTGTTTLVQSEPGSNGDEGLLQIPRAPELEPHH